MSKMAKFGPERRVLSRSIRDFAIGALSLLAAGLAPMHTNSRPLEQRIMSASVAGQVTDASTLDNVGIPGLTVSAGELGDDVTDEQGNYQISSNAVAPVYELVNYRGKEIQIFNVNGQLVDRLVPNAGQFHWNSNAAKGVYFASDNNNVYPFVNNNGAWINMPREKLAGNKFELVNSSGNPSGSKNVDLKPYDLDESYVFSIDGFVDINNFGGWEGHTWYYNYLDTLSFTDSFIKNVKMIPRYDLETTDDDFLDYLQNTQDLGVLKWGDYPGNYPVNVDINEDQAYQYLGDEAESILNDVMDALDEWNQYAGINLYNYTNVSPENRQITFDYTRSEGWFQFSPSYIQDFDGRYRIISGVVYLRNDMLGGDFGREVIRHELGHGTGWTNHAANGESIMRSSAFPPYITEITDDDGYVVRVNTLLPNNTYWCNYTQ